MQTGATPVTVDDTTYSYDNTGQVTEEADTPATATAQVQCFTYDYLGRLSTAWSQGSTTCPSSASQTAESGAAAGYWNQYQYNTAGDLTQVTATPSSGTATVTQTAYDGPDTQQTTTPDQPVHGISSVTVNPPSGSAESASYSYDQSGHLETVSGTAPSGGQSFSWDDAGRLSSVKTSDGTTSYLYDADGNLLIQEDTPTSGDPTDTLYLSDEQIVQDNTTKALSATRYYSVGGTTIAARASAGTVDYLDGNQEGTATLAVNATTLAVTRRYYDPYGNPIGTSPSWPGTQGFVGGTTDPLTTLDNLGAREYQPATGTFTSADPLLSPYDPQDLNPYAYSYDDPATDADPTGQLGSYEGAEGGCTGTAQACAPIVQNQQTGNDGQEISSAKSQISSAATYAYDHHSYQMNTLLSALIPIPAGARLLFGQARVSATFSNGGNVAGYNNVRDLAAAIRNGDVDPASIQLEGYINADGNVVFTSSRRAYALARAGYLPTSFNEINPTKNMRLRENEVSALGEELPSSRTVITPSQTDRSFSVDDIVDWAEAQAQKENNMSSAVSQPIPPVQPGFLEQAVDEAVESLDFDD